MKRRECAVGSSTMPGGCQGCTPSQTGESEDEAQLDLSSESFHARMVSVLSIEHVMCHTISQRDLGRGG
jgi:hypothetical protein